MCDTPVSLRRGIIVPCGKCADCIGMKRQDWNIRLYYEAYNSVQTLFVTLTYDDENLKFADGWKPVLYYADLRNYFKRLRKFGLKFKYFAVGEYGEKSERPHYHAILYFDEALSIHEIIMIEKKWNHGNTSIFPANEAMLKYVTKDMLKMLENYSDMDKALRPRLFCSHGIGADYIQRYEQWHSSDPYERTKIVYEGKEKHMPRYFRHKLFTKDERDHQGVIAENNRRNVDSISPNPTREQIEEIHHESLIFYEKIKRKRERQLNINHFKKTL